MRLVVLDENDKMVVEYDANQIKALLIKYIAILGDVGKAFDQISEDLLDKARSMK